MYKRQFLDRKGPKALALKMKEQLEVMTPSISAPGRQMSGGNVQKVLVGREIAQNPKVLLVAFPTRGVDVNTSHVIYQMCIRDSCCILKKEWSRRDQST